MEVYREQWIGVVTVFRVYFCDGLIIMCAPAVPGYISHG